MRIDFTIEGFVLTNSEFLKCNGSVLSGARDSKLL